MPFIFGDSTFLILIPALLLAVWAQIKVQATYAKYSRVRTRRGLTGAEAATRVLGDADVPVTQSAHRFSDREVAIMPIGGQLTDHYDPRERVLRLSEGVHDGTNVAALGVAAHEAGHAIQHAQAYAPLALRSFVYPISSIGSTLAFPLFFAGLLFPALRVLMPIAILLFTFAVVFTLVTLPVEFNASRRALLALERGGYLTEEELHGAKKVLDAAALTYVAAAAMAVLQLLRLLLIARDRD